MPSFVLGVWAAWFTTGCVPLEEGAGGGVGNFPFQRGFVFVRAGQNVYAVNDADSSTVGQLTDNGGNAEPSLSVDGRRVVFVHTEPGRTELQWVSSSGGTPTPVWTADALRTRPRQPVFTPDGQQVLFTYDVGGRSSLAVVGLDGAGFRDIVSGGLSYGSASFFPDGVTVLAAAGSSPSQLTQLVRLAVDTGQSVGVAPSLGAEAHALSHRVVVSPNGDWAAFDAAVGSSATRVFVMNLTTRAVTRLTDYPGEPFANDSFPAWRGESDVAFQSDTGGSDNVYVLPAGTVQSSGGLAVPSAQAPWYGPT